VDSNTSFLLGVPFSDYKQAYATASDVSICGRGVIKENINYDDWFNSNVYALLA